MCKLVFPEFKATLKEMWNLRFNKANERLIAEAPDKSAIIMRFDLNRDVSGARNSGGDVAIPVIVESLGNSMHNEHVIAYDKENEMWYLPCGKKNHFDWCDKRQRR